MNRTIIKNVISLVVGAGVGRVIDDAIDATAPDKVKIPVKALRKVGSWALGWFVSDCVCEKVEKTFDETMEAIDKAKEAVDEVSRENEPIENEEGTAGVLEYDEEVV